MTTERMIQIMERAIKLLPKVKPYGLCSLSYRMLWAEDITDNEMDAFDKYVNDNGPECVDLYGYQWKRGDYTARIEWLREQIEKLKQTPCKP